MSIIRLHLLVGCVTILASCPVPVKERSFVTVPQPVTMIATEALLEHALARVRSELAQVLTTVGDQVREQITPETLRSTVQTVLASPLLRAAAAEVLASAGDALAATTRAQDAG